MLKVFSLKNQKKDQPADNAASSAAASGQSSQAQQSSSKRSSAAQLRITKDMNELTLPNTCQLDFPDKDDLLNFKLIVCPDEVIIY
jgi:ubiquitin-conjugating enzyme E2 M